MTIDDLVDNDHESFEDPNGSVGPQALEIMIHCVLDDVDLSDEEEIKTSLQNIVNNYTTEKIPIEIQINF